MGVSSIACTCPLRRQGLCLSIYAQDRVLRDGEPDRHARLAGGDRHGAIAGSRHGIRHAADGEGVVGGGPTRNRLPYGIPRGLCLSFYACVLLCLQRVIATSTSCRLGIVIAGFLLDSGVLNARILRLPRPVVKNMPVLIRFRSTGCWPERWTTPRCVPTSGSSRTPRRFASIARRSGDRGPLPRRSSEPGGASPIGAEPPRTVAVRSAEHMALVCAHRSAPSRPIRGARRARRRAGSSRSTCPRGSLPCHRRQPRSKSAGRRRRGCSRCPTHPKSACVRDFPTKPGRSAQRRCLAYPDLVAGTFIPVTSPVQRVQSSTTCASRRTFHHSSCCEFGMTVE